jgi:RNA polymerase sigma-70 factor (ECF subfamily)
MDDAMPAAAPPTLAEEASAVAAARAGDEDAGALLVRWTCGRLLAVARRILRNEEDAREAVQDAYLAAFKQLDCFDGRARLATWLHRIVVNAALMKQRRRQCRPEQSIENLLPHFGEGEHQLDPPAAWPDSQQLAQRRELRELVRNRIDQLPETYRTVLLLRDIEGLETEQAARLLGTTRTVVKTRLHRARQALRTLLDPHLRSEA